MVSAVALHIFLISLPNTAEDQTVNEPALSIICHVRVNGADINVAVVGELHLLARWLADLTVLGSSQGIHLLVVGFKDLEPVVEMVAEGIIVECAVAANRIWGLRI